jgi:hypothetical protein
MLGHGRRRNRTDRHVARFKPHAYDPARDPELFRGVLARRFIAFVIDLVVIMLRVAFAAVLIFFLGRHGDDQ